MTKKLLELNFIDIFSGAGGLSNGLESAGLNCVLGIEIDKNAAFTFKENHKNAQTFCGDISTLDEKTLKYLIGNKKIHAVVGGPPCQGFSTVGIGDPKDKRNFLFKEFLRIVKLTAPDFFVIENVTGLLAKKNEKTVLAIVKFFNEMNYEIDFKVMSAEEYGVPERRRRTIFIGSKINNQIIFPRPTYNTIIGNTFNPAKTVGEALKNLKASDGKIYNHDLKTAAIKSEIDLQRIQNIPEGKGIRRSLST
jgi:DNA (cytosine-5)-methyltransferase 1